MRQLLMYLFFVSVLIHAQSYNRYSIEKITDEFDGFTIERMYGNYIPDSEIFPTNSLMFNAQRFTDMVGKQKYQFYVEWNDSDWLFIDEGEKLILLIDGERIGCRGYGSKDHRKVIAGSAVQELAVFDTDYETLNKIAKAKTVKIKLVGSSKDIIRELEEKHIENYKNFCEALSKK